MAAYKNHFASVYRIRKPVKVAIKPRITILLYNWYQNGEKALYLGKEY